MGEYTVESVDRIMAYLNELKSQATTQKVRDGLQQKIDKYLDIRLLLTTEIPDTADEAVKWENYFTSAT